VASTQCLAVALAVFAARAASAQLLSKSTIAPVGGANALSTPAARHIVRMGNGTYLLALQRDRAGAPSQSGLSWYRSDDDAQSWTFYASINPSASDRHTADVLPMGADLAMVESFDAPSIVPNASLDPARNVYFQWWRSNGASDWTPDPRVPVFTPETGTAYHRGELAVDSAGRIWVQAFRRSASSCDPAKDARCAVCDAANGDNYGNDMMVSVSTDGGRSFSPGQMLDSTICRAGGRLISAGSKLLLVWNDYSANQNGTVIVTRFMQRDASDPLGTWSTPQPAFPDLPVDGIYHGAAMSAVADGSGVHLVYKDQNLMLLWYRRFDVATGAFGPRVQVDDSEQDWALQPATTWRNGELFVFANHLLAAGGYETRMWRLSTGLGPAHATAFPADTAFHGYPSLPETLPLSALALPYVYSEAPNAAGSGDEVVMRVAADRPIATLSLEAGRAVLPAGKSIAIKVQTAIASGLSGTVQLDLSGQPAGVHFSFDPPRLAVGDTSFLTLSADPGTPHGSSICVLGMTGTSGRAVMEFQLDVVEPPAVSLRDPRTGSILSGIAHVDVEANASPGLGVSEVRLLVDGAVSAKASGSSATFTWDTTAVAEGAHDLTAVAVDDIGSLTSTAPVRVEVRNSARVGGGCTSAGAAEPLFALALAAAIARRKHKEKRRPASGEPEAS
jgi:hypothetical protein